MASLQSAEFIEPGIGSLDDPAAHARRQAKHLRLPTSSFAAGRSRVMETRRAETARPNHFAESTGCPQNTRGWMSRNALGPPVASSAREAEVQSTPPVRRSIASAVSSWQKFNSNPPHGKYLI